METGLGATWTPEVNNMMAQNLKERAQQGISLRTFGVQVDLRAHRAAAALRFCTYICGATYPRFLGMMCIAKYLLMRRLPGIRYRFYLSFKAMGPYSGLLMCPSYLYAVYSKQGPVLGILPTRKTSVRAKFRGPCFEPLGSGSLSDHISSKPALYPKGTSKPFQGILCPFTATQTLSL